MTYQNILRDYIHNFLKVNLIKDYCPNGLQVEGKEQIHSIVTGVSASIDFIKAAITKNADAVLVHHGCLWKGDPLEIIGVKYKRIKLLIAHDINLFAYHLPLDVHQEIGNNVELAKLLDLHVIGEFNTGTTPNYGVVCHSENITLDSLVSTITRILKRVPLVVGSTTSKISKIAICTGSAQDYIEHAHRAGANVYISGEISERTTLLARELGITYISAGHHATERYGIQALGNHIARTFGLTHDFIDIDNPV